MKITLNFETKQVSPQGNCNLKELVKILKVSVPDWKEWDVVQDFVYTYYPTYPLITYDYNQFDYNKYVVTCSESTSDYTNIITLTSN